MAVMTYREALNLALREEMRRDPRVFVMGEEVGLYEGAYKVTQGLLKEFGEKRIIDTPICESGFTGVGVGAAMRVRSSPPGPRESGGAEYCPTETGQVGIPIGGHLPPRLYQA